MARPAPSFFQSRRRIKTSESFVEGTRKQTLAAIYLGFEGKLIENWSLRKVILFRMSNSHWPLGSIFICRNFIFSLAKSQKFNQALRP